MNTRIFVTRKIPEAGIKMLTDKGYAVDVYPKDEVMSQKELIKSLKKERYDGVLCLLTDKIDSDVFDAAPSVKIFANYATGFDNLDIIEAKKRGVAIANAPSDIASEAVAEHGIAMALGLAARINEADRFMRAGKYRGWEPMLFIGEDLLGKTLGLVGAGRIGSRLARYAKGLDMDIVYTDVSRNKKLEQETGAVFCQTIDELLPKADIVSLHVPLLDSTRHLMDGARLKLMKRTAFLVNTSRGPVVDEAALVEALKTKTIAGAALDVFEFEPAVTRGLLKLDTVILTPHIASASAEARDDMAKIAAGNLIDFFEGKTPRNLVK